MTDELTRLKNEIAQMRLGKAKGRSKPHKPLMLLAVLDLFDAGVIRENRVPFEQDLVERFAHYFEAVRREGDWCQPAPPFFHLRTSPFWSHQPLPGREAAYRRLSTSGGGSKRIVENIAYARFDEETFGLVSDPVSRHEIREFILTGCFMLEDEEVLRAAAELESKRSSYERALETRHRVLDLEREYAVRDPAFRRVVLRAYDYQCAVCGLRIVLPDVPTPIEAAHLIPWSESRNDSPTNGMALCRIHHWALDARIIAPTLDLRWRVSALLDSRRNSERELTRFDNLPVLLPREERFYPCRESVQWRERSLLR